MRIFIAGATGALGRHLTPRLITAGHQVVGSTRHPDKEDQLRSLGADPVVMDGLDASSVRRAVLDAKPDVIVHQLTALVGAGNLKTFDQEFAVTNRLRTEGTDHLLAAAREAGTTRFVAQSYTGWPNARTGAAVKTEADPLDPDPPSPARQTLAAIRYCESTVADADSADSSGMVGIALRYGAFYGPGTGIGAGGDIVEAVRHRKLPLVGRATGVWSFCHIEDAADATALAVSRGDPGVYNIVDDDPAPVSQWLPVLAQAVGAKPPRRVPVWLARPLIGPHGISLMTQVRGSSNAKAKRALGWDPRHPSWRDGFVHAL